MFLVEGALFALAGAVAMRASLPDARRRIRRPRVFPLPTLALGIGGALLGAAQWVFLGYLTLQLSFRFDMPFTLAAAVFLGAQVSGAVGRLALGWVSDRTGRRATWLAATSVLAAACLLLFGLLARSTPPTVLVSLSLLTGFALMAWNGTLITAFAEAGPRDVASTSIGAGLLLNRVGALAAPPLFGLALAHVSPAVAWMGAAAVLGAAAITLGAVGARAGNPHPSWTR